MAGHCLKGTLKVQEELFIKFAEFEEKVKEVERARAIFRCPPLLRPA